MPLYRKMSFNVFRSNFVRGTHACNFKSFNEIPGPTSYPVLGTLGHYMLPFGPYSFNKLHRTYEKMHDQFGDIVREVVNNDRVIVHVFNPEDMSTVYLNDGSHPKRMSHRALAQYRRERPHLYSGPGLFPSNGEEWYRFRTLFSNTLMNQSIANTCSGRFEDVTNDLVKAIHSKLDLNLETDLQPLFFQWGLEAVGNITLDKRLGCFSDSNTEAASLVHATEETHSAIYKTENISFFYKKNYKKLQESQDILSNAVSKYMAEALAKRDSEQNGCILSQFMKIEGVSEKDVFTMILDMVLAGIDTTAFALSFALYHLARNKRAQDSLRKEVMEFLPTKDSRMTDSKHRMKYLKAVINETLRLNPVAVGTGRLLNKDLILGGYLVPADTMVVLQHQVASKSEKYYKNALSFEPERWLIRGQTCIASAPFGFGRRTCIGMHIAMLELRIAIAKIIRNYEISYHYEDIDTFSRLINVPDKPLKLRLKEISS